MANGHLTYRPATGHLAYSSNGHLALNCGGVESCANCTDGTPASLLATFSGVTLCSGCQTVGSQSGSVISGDVDGSYVLSQSPSNPCQWGPTSISVTVHLWDDVSCPGDPTIIIETFYAYAWKRDDGYWQLEISSDGTKVAHADTDGCYLFYALDNPTGDDTGVCLTNFPVQSNDIADCWPYITGGVAAGWMAYSGTGTLSIPP